MSTYRTPSTAGIVLCGGQSKRMGQDKSRLLYHGHTLLELACQQLQGAGIDAIFLSGNKNLNNMPIINDIYPRRGPLGGLYSCLHHLTREYRNLIVLTVDMPLLTSSLIRSLYELESQADIVRFETMFFPFRIRTESRVKSQIQDLLENVDPSKASIKHLFTRLKSLTIPLTDDERELFININTHAELRALP